MNKVNFDEMFFDFFEATKNFIPESDHVEACSELLRILDDQGYDIKGLAGSDEIVDAAILEIYPIMDDEESEY